MTPPLVLIGLHQAQGQIKRQRGSSESKMHVLELFLERAAKVDLWGVLTFLSGIIGVITALVVFSRRRFDRFSLYATYCIGTGHSLYPNVIYFEARNLGDAPVILCRPNFRPSRRLGMDDTAHGNLETQDYELKFRGLDNTGAVIPGLSYTTILLRHRDAAIAYIPIDRNCTADVFNSRARRKAFGSITFDIVTVGEKKPRVIRIKQNLRRLACEKRNLSLGRDPAGEGALVGII